MMATSLYVHEVNAKHDIDQLCIYQRLGLKVYQEDNDILSVTYQQVIFKRLCDYGAQL